MVARVVLWALSLPALALGLGGSVAHWRVPGLALPGCLVLIGYASLGVFFPEWNMYGSVLSRGRAGKRRVALTFDDGPDPETTRQVLRLLRERGLRASFFVVGHKALAHAEVLREIHEQGHVLGLHGFEHERLFCLRSVAHVARDVVRTQDAVQAACGVRPVLFRPPIGFASYRTLRGAERARVRVVGCSVRALDGVGAARPDAVAARVKRRLQDGAIVALHDAAEYGGQPPATLAALPQILDALREGGFSAVGVDEFANDECP